MVKNLPLSVYHVSSKKLKCFPSCFLIIIESRKMCTKIVFIFCSHELSWWNCFLHSDNFNDHRCNLHAQSVMINRMDGENYRHENILHGEN